jgi:sRNA-binding carbon storage regulator CsrA
MEYLQLETAPESVKLEMTMNENDIYRFTWPDLNKLMTDMKNGNMSGQSMKLTFLQAFVKLAEKQEQHDEFVQRALNIVRDMAAELYPEFTGMKDLELSFEYNSILPNSTSDLVNMLAVAVGAGITSQENAVRILDINTPETMQEIRREELAKAIQTQKKTTTTAADATENDRNKEGVNGE